MKAARESEGENDASTALGLEDGGAAFVSGDYAIELFQLIEFVDGDAEFLDFIGASVEQPVPFPFGFAVIAAERKLDVGGIEKKRSERVRTSRILVQSRVAKAGLQVWRSRTIPKPAAQKRLRAN